MMIVRELMPSGSLRDTIYGQRFQGSVLQKYGQPARSRALSLPDIAKYGRQVLEALVFLSEKGFPLGECVCSLFLLWKQLWYTIYYAALLSVWFAGQVHAGNVLLDRGTCK